MCTIKSYTTKLPILPLCKYSSFGRCKMHNLQTFMTSRWPPLLHRSLWLLYIVYSNQNWPQGFIPHRHDHCLALTCSDSSKRSEDNLKATEWPVEHHLLSVSVPCQQQETEILRMCTPCVISWLCAYAMQSWDCAITSVNPQWHHTLHIVIWWLQKI